MPIFDWVTAGTLIADSRRKKKPFLYRWYWGGKTHLLPLLAGESQVSPLIRHSYGSRGRRRRMWRRFKKAQRQLEVRLVKCKGRYHLDLPTTEEEIPFYHWLDEQRMQVYFNYCKRAHDTLEYRYIEKMFNDTGVLDKRRRNTGKKQCHVMKYHLPK